NEKSSESFVRYCDKAIRHLGENIAYAITLNEPNLLYLLEWAHLPPFIIEKQRIMLAAAAQKLNVESFSSGNAMNFEDLDKAQVNLLKAHRAAFTAIKSVRPNLPVGVSIAMTDDQAVGENSIIDKKRERLYGPWMETAKQDDFFGVQNYERALVGEKGDLPAPEDAIKGLTGGEIYPPSLAGAVRYAHEVTQKPILITEHGVGTEDDTIRAWLIPNALRELKTVMDQGVPVLGYLHWTLLDNFEWIFGYGPKFGLHSVNRETFERTPKPSAKLYGNIAKRNAL
ncbi:MAG: family 1 glycosylhydrolase, partial [Spongiibacteraceae bacterium]|nr:family 1 glycosylhydrolase [Spongiibacteraceae bacterium]